MKKLFIAILFSFPVLVIGQTDTENYVKTTAYQTPTQDGNVGIHNKQESITYYDGLGRPKQSIAVRSGGQGQNIVSYMEYDALGRSPKQYLPYATDGVVADPLEIMDQQILKTEIGNFYNTPKYENTQNPFSEMVYENSPLNRVYVQAAPGNSWALNGENGHTIKMEYQSNASNEVVHFDVTFSGGDTENPTLVEVGYYDPAQLYKNITKDENWTTSSGNNHTTEEFTNKRGQVVLKRTYADNLAHDTYYVYDDFGNLTYVLSPEASTEMANGGNPQDILDKLGYQYKYDYRNRLVEKKIPGKGWEYIVYNKLDQPVLTQDARLRESDQWLLTKYDAFGRVAYTGIVSSSQDRNWQQDTANNISAYTVYESRLPNTNTVAGTDLYYTNDSFPTGSISELLTVNYYDDYIDTDGMTVPLSVYGQATTEDASVTITTKGLPTVSKVRVLTTDNWITTITGYDAKARPIYAETKNSFLDTHDTVESLVDFVGKTIESTTTHTKANHYDIVTTDYFTYDHQNRLLSHIQKINDEPVQLIASNEYDELGQLVRKNVGGSLWEEGYTDISSNLEVSSEGEIIKISGGSAWNNAGLSTIGKLEGNGGLSFTALTSDKRFAVGLNNVDTHDGAGDLDYSFAFYWTNAKYKVRIIESGTPAFYLTGLKNFNQGDQFSIEREGDDLYFYHNGEEVATYAMNQDYNTLVGDIAMRDEGASITDLNFYPTSLTPRLQQVDYAYNVRGWLTDINNVDGQSRSTDLFNFHINYDDPVEGDAGLPGRAVPLYNGNISQTTWKSANTDDGKRTYGYTYDALNRITRAYSYKGNILDIGDYYGIRDLTYDRNGNLNSLIRTGKHFSLDSALMMDDLSYSYDGNQLMGVTDSSTSGIENQGFYDGNTIGDDYDYDVNGNMVEDKNKGITNITYNHLNLPTFVDINSVDAYGDAQDGRIAYIYDATGVKLQKQVINTVNNSTAITSYAGGYIYEDVNGLEALKMFPHPEGYVEPVLNTTKSISKYDKNAGTFTLSGFLYAFNYTDHLGNVRLTYADSDGDGAIEIKGEASEIISEKNYYPFGLIQKGYNNTISSNSNSSANKFQYNGKEIQDELGYNTYDFGARNYDPALGRWMNIDNLSESFYVVSPYNYSLNNPIYYLDPDGNTVTPAFKNPKNKELYDNLINSLKNNTYFSKVYSSLERDYDNFIVSEFTPEDTQQYKRAAAVTIYPLISTFFTSDDTRVTLRNDEIGSGFNEWTIAEEFFHVAQDQFGGTDDYYPQEAEAKVFSSLLVYQGLSKSERQDLKSINKALSRSGAKSIDKRVLIYSGRNGKEINSKITNYFDAILDGKEITEKLEKDFRAAVRQYSGILSDAKYGGFHFNGDEYNGETSTLDKILSNGKLSN